MEQVTRKRIADALEKMAKAIKLTANPALLPIHERLERELASADAKADAMKRILEGV